MNSRRPVRRIAGAALAALAALAAQGSPVAVAKTPAVKLTGVSAKAVGTTHVKVRVKVRNAARRRSGAAKLPVVLSRDGRRGRGDTRIGQIKVPGTAARRRVTVTRRLRVSPRLRSGRYVVLVCVTAKASSCRAARGKLSFAESPAPAPVTVPAPAPPADRTPGGPPSDRTPAGPPSRGPDPGPGADVLGPPDDGEFLVETFSAVDQLPDVAADEAALGRAREKACVPHDPRPTPPLGEALGAARSFLERTAGADAMAQFAASAEHASARGSLDAAALALQQGQPGAALAALIRAHELEPGEASHLVSASAVASAVGLHVEALGLLDGAAALPDADAAPMRIGLRATALANRGQALTGLGRYSEAADALRAALASEPLLSEAAATLATAELCTAGPAAAVRSYRRARHRDPRAHERIGDQAHDGVDFAFDESEGRETAYRPLSLPGNPTTALAARTYFRELATQSRAVQDSLLERYWVLRDRIRARGKAAWTHFNAAQRRSQTLLGPSGKEFETARHQIGLRIAEEQFDFRQRYTEIDEEATAACAGIEDFEEARACERQQVRERCTPALAATHTRGMNLIADHQMLIADRVRVTSRSTSAISANFASAEGYEVGMNAIKGYEISERGAIARSVDRWGGFLRNYDGTCFNPPDEPLPGSTDKDQEPKGPGACPESLTAIKAVIDLGVAKVKANCEEVTLGGESPGWLKAFAEVKYHVPTDRVTVTVGSKADVAGLGFGSGVFVTASAEGIEDLGWKVGPSFEVGAGPVEFSPSSEIEMGIVGSAPPAPIRPFSP